MPVERVKDLRSREGKWCFGIWTCDDRKVRIDADISSVGEWQTYWHEWVHVALWDAGVKLKEAKAELVCDALATARVREMLDAAAR